MIDLIHLLVRSIESVLVQIHLFISLPNPSIKVILHLGSGFLRCSGLLYSSGVLGLFGGLDDSIYLCCLDTLVGALHLHDSMSELSVHG